MHKIHAHLLAQCICYDHSNHIKIVASEYGECPTAIESACDEIIE